MRIRRVVLYDAGESFVPAATLVGDVVALWVAEPFALL